MVTWPRSSLISIEQLVLRIEYERCRRKNDQPYDKEALAMAEELLELRGLLEATRTDVYPRRD